MTPSSERVRIIGRVADHILADRPGHTLRVAVDGVTAAGKTTFADELAAALLARGRPTIRLSMDGFHHPREHRYRQGRASAQGYYRDAYDFTGLADHVLEPLGPEGSGTYRTAIHDLETDQPLGGPRVRAAPDAVLVVDGTFLQNPVLLGLWDEVVYLDTDVAVAEDRAAGRDVHLFGSPQAVREAYRGRYHAACRLYADEVDPLGRAGIVVGNDDLDHPQLRRIGGTVAETAELFSYGTLQQPDVQLVTFGRELGSRPDGLAGHRRDWVTITDPSVLATSGSDRHPILSPSDDPEDRVEGSVLTLTTTELAAADRYEVADYRRVRVTLASGSPAWVYLASAQPR